MTFRLSIGLISVILGPLAAQAERVFPADVPQAYHEGRVAYAANHQVAWGFPGITLHLKVRAAHVSARIAVTKNAFFDLIVDGGAARLITLSDGDHLVPLLADAGSPRVHTIELTRRTESWQGQCVIESLSTEDGGELLDVARPSFCLEFIGDSITCGAGELPSPTGELYDPLRSNARISYGKLIAGRLGAECFLVSYGGRGVFRDWQGIRAITNAPDFYERTLPDDAQTHWDFSRHVPAAIGICLGTNDFNQGIPDENEFVNAYVEFVRKVRRDAPKATVFLIDSPMIADGDIPKRLVAHAYIEEVTQKLDSPLVNHIPLPHYHGSKGDAHPTAADHEAIAQFLLPYFASAVKGS